MASRPLISGFTFIKNGLTLGYPIKESIESISSLCDEIIINVGYDDPSFEADDGTWDYLHEHFTDPKYHFIKSWWDPSLTTKGVILCQQANIALKLCHGKYCQYIQGDEVIHENDIPKIRAAVEEMEKDEKIQGLVYDFIHFYGNTDAYRSSHDIYRREVRLVRNGIGALARFHASGFRLDRDKKLKCKVADAHIYHYGWARKEKLMEQKLMSFNKLHGGGHQKTADFQYSRIWGLKKFESEHPAVMKDWIKDNHDDFDVMALPYKFSWKDLWLRFSDWIEGLTGYRIGEYKNYKLL